MINNEMNTINVERALAATILNEQITDAAHTDMLKDDLAN